MRRTHEEWRAFIGRAEQLQHELSSADVAAGDRARTLPASAQRRYSEAVEAIDPPLPHRYRSAELLMRGVITILRDGRDGAPLLDDDPRYLLEKIGPALAPYGLRVEKAAEPGHRRQVRSLLHLRGKYTATNGDTLPPAAKK